jgi:hypothetical protein
MQTPSSILASLVAIGSAAALLGGCDPGAVEDGTIEDEILCQAELTMVGTFAVGTPKPDEINGCWPIGTWTFTATVGTHDCAQAPTPLPQYQIRVDRDLTSEDPDYSWLYTYVTDPADTTGFCSSSKTMCGVLAVSAARSAPARCNCSIAVLSTSATLSSSPAAIHSIIDFRLTLLMIKEGELPSACSRYFAISRR